MQIERRLTDPKRERHETKPPPKVRSATSALAILYACGDLGCGHKVVCCFVAGGEVRGLGRLVQTHRGHATSVLAAAHRGADRGQAEEAS